MVGGSETWTGRPFTDAIHYVLPKLLLIATAFDEGWERKAKVDKLLVPEAGIPAGIAEETVKVPMVSPDRADERVRLLFEDIQEKHRHPGVASYYIKGMLDGPLAARSSVQRRCQEQTEQLRRRVMKWVKAAAVGILAALVMFIFIVLAIQRGMAPFNIPPSAAMLTTLGINVGPVALLVHFGYGAFWSMALVYLFQERTNIWNGIGLALALWLVMMIIYSPIIGWGFFGFGGSGSTLSPDDPLFLAPGPKYLVATLVLHLIYGAIIGWLNPLWIEFRTSPSR